MTVQELIDIFNKMEDKTQETYFVADITLKVGEQIVAESQLDLEGDLFQ